MNPAKTAKYIINEKFEDGVYELIMTLTTKKEVRDFAEESLHNLSVNSHDYSIKLEDTYSLMSIFAEEIAIYNCDQYLNNTGDDW